MSTKAQNDNRKEGRSRFLLLLALLMLAVQGFIWLGIIDFFCVFSLVYLFSSIPGLMFIAFWVAGGFLAYPAVPKFYAEYKLGHNKEAFRALIWVIIGSGLMIAPILFELPSLGAESCLF
jgi:hypothetical protein